MSRVPEIRCLVLAIALCVILTGPATAKGASVSPTGTVLWEDFSTDESGRLHADWMPPIHFRGDTELRVGVRSENDNPVLSMEFDKAGYACDTLYTAITPPGVDRRLLLSLRYKTPSLAMPMIAAVSSGPGCGAPAIKQVITLVDDDQWHSVELAYDLAGLNPERMVFEFLLEGNVSPGYVLIDDVRLSLEPEATFEARLHSPGSRQVFEGVEDQTVRLELTSRGSHGRFHIALAQRGGAASVMEKQVEVAGTERVVLDLSGQPVGEYTLTATAEGHDEQWAWPVTKHPRKENAVLIHDGLPYVNGEPFLMLGLYHSSDRVIEIINQQNAEGTGAGELSREEVFASLRERGFNAVHASWSIGTKDYYQAAAEQGLMVVTGGGPADPAALPAGARDFPNLFAWYVIDEPKASLAPELEAIYRRYKEYDPYHPVITAFDGGGVGFGDYRVVDIASPDPYPIVDAQSSTRVSAEHVRSCRESLNRGDPTTCVIYIPQLFAANGSRWQGIEPTYDQLRSEVYGAITVGAKGVFYYAYYTHEDLQNGMARNPKRKHWFLPESNLWDAVGQLNAELQELSNVILLGEECPQIALAGESQVLFRAVGLGERCYLFLVNPEPIGLSSVSVSGLSGEETPVPLFDSPAMRREETGPWKTDLPAYAVGVYTCRRQK